jgi:magnesium transporter
MPSSLSSSARRAARRLTSSALAPSFLAPSRPLSAKKVGLPPGAVVFVGRERDAPVRLTVMDYDAATLAEAEYAAANVEAVFPLRDTPTTSWIHADGVHDTALVQALGAHFGIDALAQEDLVNTAQRPKVEAFGDVLLVVAKQVRLDDEGRLTAEQVGLVVGDGFLLSFQETPNGLFAPVRERLRQGRGRIRSRGADYLAYALLDVVVDHYGVALAALSDRAEVIEDRVLGGDVPAALQDEINALRRALIGVRRVAWPLRDLLAAAARTEHPRLGDDVAPFWRDAHDHAVQVADTVDALRDVVGSVHDLYLSVLSHRMNEIMKVLTIISTIFIPLTFIAGIYGMNFTYMPELQTRYGYFVALGVMGALAVVLLALFRRRGWI